MIVRGVGVRTWSAVVVVLLAWLGGPYALAPPRITTCPSLCRCLEKGSIFACPGAGFYQFPDMLSTAIVMDFDHNHIALIRNDTFQGTPRVEMLTLEDNQLQDIESGAFNVMHNLHTLNLRKNLVSSLPVNIFKNNPNLEYLDLSKNYLTIIPDYVLPPLHKLQSLNLSFNLLDAAHLSSGFSHTKELRILDLSANNFVSIDQKSFRAVRSWNRNVPHNLNISFCNIHRIHDHSLQHVGYFETLSFAGNPSISIRQLQHSLETINESQIQTLNLANLNLSDIFQFFRNFQHPRLQNLNLALNRIQNIRRGTFYYLTDLRHLDLSHNQIWSVEDLGSLNRLTSLDLSHNQLHYIDSVSFESIQNLQYLDLSHNALTQLSDDPFLDLFELQSLDISFNKISRITIASGLENLQTLHAQNNVLSDIEFVATLRRLTKLNLSNNFIQQIGPDLLPRGQHMLMLNLSGNMLFNILDDTFLFVSQDTIDLANNQLLGLSNVGWTRARRLDLSRNFLYNISASAFQALDMLEELYLGWNRLVAFSKGTFEDLVKLRVLGLQQNPLGMFLSLPGVGPMIGLNALRSLETLHLSGVNLYHFPMQLLANLSSLKSLDLSDNFISVLSRTTFSHFRNLHVINLARNQITNVEPQVFHVIRGLESVDLALNPFDCTCSLMPLRVWLISTLSDHEGVTIKNFHDMELYRCATPPEQHHVTLVNFYVEPSFCASSHHTVVLVVAVCVLAVLCLAVVVCVVRFRWRHRRNCASKAAFIKKYPYVEDTSTATLTGNQSVSTNSTTKSCKNWV